MITDRWLNKMREDGGVWVIDFGLHNVWRDGRYNIRGLKVRVMDMRSKKYVVKTFAKAIGMQFEYEDHSRRVGWRLKIRSLDERAFTKELEKIDLVFSNGKNQEILYQKSVGGIPVDNKKIQNEILESELQKEFIRAKKGRV